MSAHYNFIIPEGERPEVDKFIKAHRHTRIDKGSIGGGISYVFSPTSVGMIVLVKCSICNKQLYASGNL